jgi:hypothetical protein
MVRAARCRWAVSLNGISRYVNGPLGDDEADALMLLSWALDGCPKPEKKTKAMAEEMISSLTLSYNKARQASITKELLEVTTGAEALRYAKQKK